MRNRRAILFFLFWSAVFALALFLQSISVRKDVAPSDASMSALDVREVVRIDMLRRKDAGRRESLSIVYVNGRWRIEDPVSVEADEESVKRLVETILFSEPGDALSESDMARLGRSSRDFGLAAPRCTVTISTTDSRETFSVGRKTAVGNEVYMGREGYKGVFTVPARIADEVMRPLVDFRRRRLFTFRSPDVMGVGLRDAGEPMTRLGKSDGQWRISNPVNAPADRQMVEDLIDVLCSAHVEDYVLDAGSGHGLGEGEGFAVSLRDSFGAVERVVFGVPDGTNLVWAMTSEGAVVHVRKEVLDHCRGRQKTLEDMRIFPVEASAVTMFSVAKGFPAYVVSRKGAAAPWTMVSPVDVLADVKVVDALLSNVLSLRGIELLSEGDEDVVMVSVGTASTNFNARYVSRDILMKGIKPVDLMDKTIVRRPRDRIRRVMVRTAAGDEWNAAASEDLISLLEGGIDAERVERIVLKAEDFRRYGFNHPSHTVSFEFKDDASSMRRMLIGAVAPGGGRYAMIGGLDAAFVLSPSVVSVLTKPVDSSMEKKR